ncbi:hypothetical protein CRE_01450 [Caenorhabditis remanei]|uniref:Uncharacterized protein n=1 Tax=Caenorhabditis remanei TaxID=31234 RepID=E3NN73_CAERE|nr:hypothetical protein CRE_01450 [Caenorhabditis remanei]
MKIVIERFEESREECDGMDVEFAAPSQKLIDVETTKDLEEKFHITANRIEEEGTEYVKKKVGSALISNKTLPVPEFDGEPENWAEFYDIFKPIVEDNTELLDIVKFALLKKACRGKAGDMIRIFTSADCFKEAIERLKKNYENKDNRFLMLWDKLEELRPARENVESMRRTINEVAAIVAALRKVSETETMAMKVLIKRKFPRRIHEELSRDANCDTTGKILEKIEDTINREERIEKDMIGHKKLEGDRRNSYRRSNSREYNNYRRSNSREYNNYRTPEYKGNNRHRSSDSYTSQKSDKSEKSTNSYRKSPFPRSRSRERKPCLFCNRSDHSTIDCRKVSNPEDRREFFRNHQRCYNCGRNDHSVKECTSGRCRNCDRKHHTALCDREGNRVRFERNRSRSKSEERYVSNKRGYGKDSSYSRVNTVVSSETRLMVTTGRVITTKSTHGEKFRPKAETMVILDTGADTNYITEQLAEYIGARVIDKNKDMRIKMVNNKENKITSNKVRFELMTQNGNIVVEALTIPSITTDFMPAPIEPEEWEYLKKRDIPYKEPSKTDAGLLIGVDLFWRLMNNFENLILPTGRIVVNTKLGNVICGSIIDTQNTGTDKEESNNFMTRKSGIIENPVEKIPGRLEITHTLEDLFQLQNIGITDNPVDPKIEEIKQMFYDTVRQDEGGRVETTFPFKKGMIPVLADNFRMALARLVSMYKQSRNTKAWEKLVQNFEDMIKRGIIEDTKPVAIDEPDRPVYFIPYQLVYNENSNTTKVRTVFDASSAVRGEISLNKAIHQGPSLIPQLLGILIRIRTRKYVLSGDIEKAFHMVGLQEKHRDCTRFLWLKDPQGEVIDKNLRFMRFTRIPFGVNASPYLLAMAIEYAIQHSMASEKLKTAVKDMCYVDNLFGTSNKAEELIELYKESKEVFNAIGMNIREFSLNSELENLIDPKDKTETGDNTKLLGYMFNGKTDIMKVKKPKFSLIPDKGVTKREVVKIVSSIYDPLQLFAPIYLDGKRLIREVSGKDIKWEDKIKEETRKLLEEYVSKIEKCEFTFKRWLEIPDKQPCTLAIFSDASKDVYGACAYLVWDPSPLEKNKENRAILITAKQRLASKGHTITIPRLELVGIVLAARIATYLVKELDVNITTIALYSDSQIALNQIKSFNKDSTFVENRINEIWKHLEKLKTDENDTVIREVYLTHVPTNDNTADLITRGIETEELLKETNWFKGPQCIRRKEEANTENRIYERVNKNPKMPYNHQRESYITLVSKVKNVDHPPDCSIIQDKHRQHWDRSCRIMVYILRFITRIRIRDRTHTGIISNYEFSIIELQKYNPNVKSEELECAEKVLIKEHQTNFNIKPMENLNQYLNPATKVVEQRYRVTSMEPKPVIHTRSILATSIIDKIHSENLHCGVNTVLGIIREKYAGKKWRSAIKNRLTKCIRCRKVNNHPYPKPKAGNLPERRITKDRAFQHIGIDYAGPFIVKAPGGRGYTAHKSWIAVITCMTSRLVHLELVYSLTTDEFLLALARFMGRRGIPDSISTDNATTFQAAANIATSAYSVENYLANKRIKWYFNTALAPWEGGVWERMVGLVKKALKHGLGDQCYSRKDLETIIIECESIINHRPLTYIADEESEIIRPIDLIQPKISYPIYNEKLLENEYREYTYRFREVINSVKRFWEVFNRDYQNQNKIFESVTFPNKAHCNTVQPVVGEIVMIKDEQLPRGKWQLGRITKLCPGKDEIVRAVEIKTKTRNKIKRRIEHVIPLEIRPNSETQQVYEEKEKPQQKEKERKDQKVSEKPSRRITRSQTRKEKEKQASIMSIRTQMKPTILYYLTIILYLATSVYAANKNPSLSELSIGTFQEAKEEMTIVQENVATTTYSPNSVRNENRITTLTPLILTTTPKTTYPVTTPRSIDTTKPMYTTKKPKISTTSQPKQQTTTTPKPRTDHGKQTKTPLEPLYGVQTLWCSMKSSIWCLAGFGGK